MDHGLTPRNIDVLVCVTARLRKLGTLTNSDHGKRNDVMRMNEIYSEDIGIDEYDELLTKLDKINARFPTVEPPP